MRKDDGRKRKRRMVTALAALLALSVGLAPSGARAEVPAAQVTGEASEGASAPATKAAPAQAPEPTQAPTQTKAPEVTQAPAQTQAPEITQAPAQTQAPEVTQAPAHSASPETSPNPEHSSSPEATQAPAHSVSPEASPSPEHSASPEASPSPEHSASPEASPSPEHSASPEASPGPEATLLPEPTVSDEPLPSPEPIPTPDVDGLVMLERSHSAHNSRLNPSSLRYPEDGMPIPLLFQSDYGRGVCEYGGETKSVSSSGCGAAAASMLIAYLKADYEQTPYTLFYEAAADGRYCGQGLDFEALQSMLSGHGVSAGMEGVSRSNIRSALEKGRPIIINMGPGAFTDGGHYIVLRGLNEDGRVLVNDPASEGRSGDSYSLKLIVNESKGGKMLVAYTKAATTRAPEVTQAPEAEAAQAPAEVEAAPAPEAADGEMEAVLDATRAPEMPVAEDLPLR